MLIVGIVPPGLELKVLEKKKCVKFTTRCVAQAGEVSSIVNGFPDRFLPISVQGLYPLHLLHPCKLMAFHAWWRVLKLDFDKIKLVRAILSMILSKSCLR